jgi:hypothetical protein
MLETLAVNGAGTSCSAAAQLKDLCRQLLLRSQNEDGGWPYQLGMKSAVEPTCWAVIALAQSSENFNATNRGVRSLEAAQLPDGSWPTRPGHQAGCWVTSLALLASFAFGGDCEPVRKGLSWLSDAWPAEGNLGWRVRNWLRPAGRVTRQNGALRGWSWTPDAASWVEPTSYALLLLNTIPENLHPRVAAKRRRLGEAMLYDRMCTAGGWNSGNPEVYGVAGERRVGPTVWALLALKEHTRCPGNQRSLDWLEQAYADVSGPASLVLAHVGLEACGRPQQGFETRLGAMYETNGFLENVAAAALSLIALCPEQERPAAFRRPT